MAKEDFKNGKEPIDMSDYPYQTGQTLDNGIKILSVIRGDVNDSFGGYKMQPILDVKGTKKIYGEPYILNQSGHTDREGRNALKDSNNWPPEAIDIDEEMIEAVGDPYAQCVYFRVPNDKHTYRLTPEEFLEYAKNGAKKPEPQPAAIIEPEEATDGWTDGDNEFIIQNYKTMSDADMAKVLEVDPESLKRHRLDDLKLSKKPGA